MGRKAGRWFVVGLLVPAAVLLRTQCRGLVEQIKASPQLLVQRLLPGPEKLLTLPVSQGDTTEQQEADAQAERQKAIQALEESRARAEAARRRSGDPTPTVDAIVTTAGNRPGVLIAGELVSEGQTVLGYRICKIRPDAVEFEKDGQSWTQRID